MINVEKILFQFLDAKRDLKMIEERIEMVKSDLLPKSPSITGMPGAHNPTDKYADTMAKLEELYALEDKLRFQAINKMQMIEELIERIEKPILKSILYDRYIMGNKWEIVAKHMDYSLPRIFQLRKQALSEMVNLIDDCK